MSPIEANYGLVPDVSRLRRWGCWCFVHIHQETRPKGFIDKAYKAFSLGFDVKTQSYIFYVLALDKIQLSAHVIFDELSEVGKTTQNSMLEFTEPANVEDFKYLENMLYMDEHIIYVTTRVIRQQDLIVAYRAPYLNGVLGQEESRPIHVQDVDKLVDEYILKFSPQVIATGETNVTKIDVEDTSKRKRTGNDPILMHGDEKRSRQSSSSRAIGMETDQSWQSSDGAKNIEIDDDVHTPPGRWMVDDDNDDQFDALPEMETRMATSVMESAKSGPTLKSKHSALPMSDVSNTMRRSPRLNIAVGNPATVMQAVCYDYQGDSYALHLNHMAEYLIHHDFYAIENGVPTALSATLADDWLAADIEEVKSLVLEHNVWLILAPTSIVNALGMKWVRTTKSSGRKKSRLVGQGFNMIHGVDYYETFAPVARMVTLRILLTFIALYSLFTGSLDVKTAFLNAPIQEDVWLKPPKELRRLLKKLYKQTKNPAHRKILKKQI
jgi:hypothetical protein